MLHGGHEVDVGIGAAGETVSFFELHHDTLAEVFDITGVPRTVLNSLDETVAATQPWVAGDHSRPSHLFDLTDEQKVALKPLYNEMGMVEEQKLMPGNYRQIVVLGAIQQGNNNRLGFVNRMLTGNNVTTGKLVLLGGQRHMYVEREKGDVEANIAEVVATGSNDPWFARVASKGSDALAWETDMMRLAGIARLGNLTLRQLHLRLGTSDPIRRYEFSGPENTDVSLLHTLAVARPNGEPRHTTEACIIDWAKEYNPGKNEQVAFVGANPHLNRMVRSSRRVLQICGRGDIELIACGPAAPATAGDSIYLGEIARSLYEDQQYARLSGFF